MREVEERRNRETGTTVLLIDNRDDGFEVGGQPWITLCDDHGNYCEHLTRDVARSFLAAPSEWCGGCALIEQRNREEKR